MPEKPGAGWPGASRSSVYWKLALITALGACLRLYRLDHQSLWHDEAISLTVGRAPLDRMLEYFTGSESRIPLEYNPPVYFYLLHAWFNIFGFGDFQARLLSAVAGVLSLPLIFLLAEDLYDTSTGLCAALLLAVSQLGVMYSQEARNYELFMLLFLGTMYFYRIAVSRQSLAAWSGFTLSAVLMVGTQYYGAFAILALAAYAAFSRRLVPLTWLVGASVAGGLALVPWLRFALAAQVRATSDHVQPDYFSVSPTTLASTLNRFNNGAVLGVMDSAPLWTFVAGGIIFGGPLILALARAWRPEFGADQEERRSTAFTSLMWAGPLACVLALGVLFNVQFNVRYVAFCIAPYYMLVAAGISRLPSRLRSLTMIAIVCYSGYALTANYYVPYKENYRDAIRFVAGEARPDDCYAFAPFGGRPLEWSIYASYGPARLLAPDRPLPAASECPRIWVLTYQRAAMKAQARWRAWLPVATAQYAKRADQQFFWIRVERYDAGH